MLAARTVRGFLRGDPNLMFDAVFVPKGIDISGNGRHASDTGTEGIPPKIGKYSNSRRVWAKGTGEYFSYASNPEPGAVPFTAGFSVKIHVAQGDQQVLNGQQDSTHGFMMTARGSPTHVDFQALTGSGSWDGGLTGDRILYDGVGYLAIASAIGNVRKVYVNGAIDKMGTVSGSGYNSGTTYYTSAYANNLGVDVGRLDMELSELWVLKREMSPVECMALGRYMQRNPMAALWNASTVLVVSQAVDATIKGAITLSKLPDKIITATTKGSSAVTKLMNVAATATIKGAATVIKDLYQAITATIKGVATTVQGILFTVTQTATVAGSASVQAVKVIIQAITATVAGSATVTNINSFVRTVTATIKGSATTLAGIMHSVIVTATIKGTATANTGIQKMITAVISGYGRMIEMFYRSKYRKQNDEYTKKY